MRTFVPGLVNFGAFVLVALIGAIAFFVAGKLVPPVDASANGSHLSAFIVAVTGLTVAVASAFPIFAYGVPWAAARLEQQQEKGDTPWSETAGDT
jgi:hypothetical protein